MSKIDWNVWADAEFAQPGRIRQVLDEVAKARVFMDKIDPAPKPEQQQLQLTAPDPPAALPIAPQVDPQPAVRSGVLDEGAEPSAEQKNRNKCHWTAAECSRAEALIDWGTPIPRVAEIMGRTVKGIQSALSVGTLKPKTWKPDPRNQASGRRSALSRGYVLRNGAELPH